MLLTASASYFRPDDAAALGSWVPEKLESWVNANLDWVNRRWPNQVAAWRLDLDESTPHLDVFFVPVAQRKTKGGRSKVEVSHRAAFGASRQSFGELQDEYAEAMSPLGLNRGRPRSVTNAVHVHPALLRAKMLSEAKYQRALHIGLKGILRKDIRNLHLMADGGLSAAFHQRVPDGVKDRFLSLMRPASSALVAFEAQLKTSISDFVLHVTRELTVEIRGDRQKATELVNEAHELRQELAQLDPFIHLGTDSKVAHLVKELTL